MKAIKAVWFVGLLFMALGCKKTCPPPKVEEAKLMIVRSADGAKFLKVTGIWDHNKWESIGDVICKCPKCIMCQPPAPTDVETDMQMKAEEAMKKFGVTGFVVVDPKYGAPAAQPTEAPGGAADPAANPGGGPK